MLTTMFISPRKEVDIRKENIKMHQKNVFCGDFFGEMEKIHIVCILLSFKCPQ